MVNRIGRGNQIGRANQIGMGMNQEGEEEGKEDKKRVEGLEISRDWINYYQLKKINIIRSNKYK